MKHAILLILVSLAFGFQSIGQNASEPATGKKMTFQGSLYQNGEPFSGTATLKFSIQIDTSTWSETQPDVSIVNGLYSVVLGQFSPLPKELFYDADERTITVQVNDAVLGNVKLYAPFQSKLDISRLDLKDTLDRTGVTLARRAEGGGLLYFPSTSNQYTYNWIQNRVSADGSAAGSAQVANIASDGSYVTGTGMSGGFFYIDSWANERFYTNVELGLSANDPKLPYMHLRGSDPIDWTDDNNTPDDTSDDTFGSYLPNLISLETRVWEDGEQYGNLMLRGSDGSEFGINSHGLGMIENLKANRIEMNDANDSTSLILSRRAAGGGLLYFPGKNGATYNWIQNRVNEDGSATGSAQVANLASDGSYVTGTGMSGGFFYIDSWANEQFYTNVELGLSQSDPKLPYMYLRGSEPIDWVDDKGTPEDTSDDTSGSYLPNLISFETQQWEDGNQYGVLNLRGSDGSEFSINSHGLGNMENLKLHGPNSLNIELASRSWENADLGFLSMYGARTNADDTPASVLTMGSYMSSGNGNEYGRMDLFTVNESGERIKRIEFKADPNRLYFFNDGSTRLAEIGTFGDNSGYSILSGPSGVKNIQMGGSDANRDLGMLRLSGTEENNLVNLEIEGWDMDDNGEPDTEVGTLKLRSQDGSEFGISAYGFLAPLSNTTQVGQNESGTYTQQQSAAFRIKNDADPFSGVFLNRANDGSARLQLVGHDAGTATGTTYLGTNLTGPYMYMSAPSADGTIANTSMTDLYTTGNHVDGTAYANNYKRSGVDFYDNEGTRLAALGSARDENGNDPTGKSGLMMLWGTSDVPNVEITGKRWENAQLPIMQLFGSTTNGNGWYHANAIVEVSDDATHEWGSLTLNKTDKALETSESTITMDGNTGNINIAGTLAQNSDERLKTNIGTLNGALDKTLQMRGVSYTWKDKSRSQKVQIGVIAQEVEAIYPEFVHTDENGIKSVNYAQMTAVLIEAVKELNAEIETLKADNEGLRAEVGKSEELEVRLAQIEKLLGVKPGDTSNAANK